MNCERCGMLVREDTIEQSKARGSRDCKDKDHVSPSAPTPLELERNDISYRTGRLSELQDYMRELHG
jgi:hypothetical protein